MATPPDPSVSPPKRQFAVLVRRLAERYGPDSREISPGHWAFEVPTGSGRSQVVHLLLHERASDAEDASRLIASSPIGPVPARLDAEALLRRNARLDVGAIGIEDVRTDEGPRPFLTLRATQPLLSAEFDEAWEMVECIGRTADALEKDLFVHDVF